MPLMLVLCFNQTTAFKYTIIQIWGINMLKQAAILLTAIAITACGENTDVSSITTETAQTKEEKKAANLKEATKAAIVIQSYEVEENKVTPATKSEGAGGAER
tara:strand:+ start:2302 stop:2610 length:309 start_codon:yes stop_codon:yes gene_type:complete